MKFVMGIVVAIIILWFLLRIFARNPSVVPLQPDDEEMTAAIAKARETVDSFLAALKVPGPHQSEFSVKKRYPVTDDSAEHLWIVNVSFDGETIRGQVGNEPKHIKDVRMGDSASVKPDEVSDWKFIEDGRLVGGYSIRLLVDRMEERQRKEFLENVGFKLE